MNSDNLVVIFCEDGGEHRVNCEICDKLCIYKNQLKSQTHIINIQKIEQ